ncbi:MAG: hypothetical protein D6725_10860 [Planctomycetota bacterium]|nr:MAG: hypothetical protein D6725_10860 [Planctomycetota bacterium]
MGDRSADAAARSRFRPRPESPTAGADSAVGTTVWPTEPTNAAEVRPIRRRSNRLPPRSLRHAGRSGEKDTTPVAAHGFTVPQPPGQHVRRNLRQRFRFASRFARPKHPDRPRMTDTRSRS